MNFNVITLTDAAAERVKAIMAAGEDDIIGLRVGLENAGCAGVAYTMDYVSAVPDDADMVEDKGVAVYVDRKATLFLLGTEMDYVTEKLSSRFTFNNPNQTGACGCGESVQLSAADLKEISQETSVTN